MPTSKPARVTSITNDIVIYDSYINPEATSNNLKVNFNMAQNGENKKCQGQSSKTCPHHFSMKKDITIIA